MTELVGRIAESKVTLLNISHVVRTSAGIRPKPLW